MEEKIWGKDHLNVVIIDEISERNHVKITTLKKVLSRMKYNFDLLFF